MYWIFALSVAVIGQIVCWIVLSRRWRKISGVDDPIKRVFNRMMIQQARLMNPILPGDAGYLDLKFSALRHGIAFLITAAILFFVNRSFVVNTFLWLNLLYTFAAVNRYRNRKKLLYAMVREAASDDEAAICVTLVKDSFVVVAYAIVAAIAQYTLIIFK